MPVAEVNTTVRLMLVPDIGIGLILELLAGSSNGIVYTVRMEPGIQQ